MRLDLSYNDVSVSVCINYDELGKEKTGSIRAKTLEFFDFIESVLPIRNQGLATEKSYNLTAYNSETNETLELPTSEIYEFRHSSVTNTGEINKTINEITGDKRVEKKRYEDMSIEELGVDVRGLPWNPEIHAQTKTKRKDGTWKLKKGSNLLQAEEQEKQILQDLPPPPPRSDEEIQINQREIPKTFNAMMDFINEISDTGRINVEGILRILSDLGFSSVLHLKGNESAYKSIYERFHAVLGGVL